MNHFLFFSQYKATLLFIMFVLWNTCSYGDPVVEAVKKDTISKPKTATNPPPKFRIGAQIGYGYRLESAPANSFPSIINHISKLRHNISFGADISYYLKNNFGFGVIYQGISSKNSSSNIPYPNEDGTFFHDFLSEDIEIHCIGPFLSFRYFIVPNKQSCFANIGAGYTRYKNDAVFITDNVRITGNTAVFFTDIGYDFFIHKYFSIGLQVSMIVGAMRIVNYTSGNITIKEELDITQRENLSHIDFSVAFRFNK